MLKKRILVVDDEKGFTSMLRLNLEATGDYEVLVENDSKNALSAAMQYRPDLILLDIVLPHKDGWRVLKEIKQNQKFKNVQIIMLTNLGQKMEVEKGLKLGAEKYLIKAHYTPQQVAEEVKKLLK